jgi:peflin
MHQQQYSSHSPARTPQPPEPGSAELGSIFQAANISRTGHLTTTELGSALVNGDYTPFDPSTNQALMHMFSTSPSGQPQGLTLTYAEFQNLWAFLAAWKDLFEKFDEDRSGRISLIEFSNALVAFGYRLSQPFVGLLYHTYNDKGMRIANERRGSRGVLQKEGMSFDLFVQACVHLKRMTDAFKNYDDDRDGYITVSFEEFLTEILKLRD